MKIVNKHSKFGRLSVLRELPRKQKYVRRFLCECSCGNKKIVRLSNLLNGNVKSCGCLRRELGRDYCLKNFTEKTHGKTGSKTYSVWSGMIQRCKNKKNKQYKNYGGRGIKVCDRWLKFENFYEDMGNAPTGKSLERVDNNGNYCYENCKWTDWNEQANNKRNNIFVSVNKVKISFNELAHMFGLERNTLYYRIFKYKWSLRKALTIK